MVSWLREAVVRLNTMSKGSSNSVQLSSRSQASPIDVRDRELGVAGLEVFDDLRAGAAQDFQLDLAEAACAAR